MEELNKDELDYLQLMKDRQQAAYRLGVESERLTKEARVKL